MYPRLSIYQPAILLTLCLLLVFHTRPALAENTPAAADTSYLIQDIKSNLQGDALSIEIVGNNPPVYTMYELFNPNRLILDIAHATVDKKIDVAHVLPGNNFAKLVTKALTDQDPSITRFEITINESHTYSVDRDKNNLLILIHPKTDSVQTGTPAAAKETPSAVPSAQKEAKQEAQTTAAGNAPAPADTTM